MQLKIKRSQRDTGIFSKTAVFCLDARAEFTPEEQDSISRYKLGGEIIYNSEAAKRLIAKRDAQFDGSTHGALKSIITTGLAAMHLNITISSLAQGHHIECKSLDELRGAEAALMDACASLKGYLEDAATFDGRTVLIGFDGEDGPQVIAQAIPQKVIAPPPLLPEARPERAPLKIEQEEQSPHAALIGPEPDPYAAYAPAARNIPEQLNDLITPKNILIAIGVVFLLLILKSQM